MEETSGETEARRTRFGVNALFMIPGQVGGTETYLRRTLAAAATRLREDEELVVFANAENRRALALDLKDAPRTTVVDTGLRAESRVRRVLFENLSLPRLVRAAEIDVLWNPGNAAPARIPCPQATAVFDMQYCHFPEDFSRLALFAMRRLVPAAVRRSAVVLAPSEFSRQEIHAQLPRTPPGRVLVTHYAAEPELARPLPGPFVAERILALTRYADPILLAVGNTYPHKDFATAVAAFGRICDRIPHRLVLVGRPRLGEPAVEAAVAALPPGARFTRLGYVLREDLRALYQGADAFVLPSRYEGFGLPVLEAMAAGLPVVAAREGSVPEVAGDAAIFARTGDPDDFAAALLRLLAGPGAEEERARLAALGRARAARFSWDATAEATLEALRACVPAREPR